jgi:hypothetical protein
MPRQLISAAALVVAALTACSDSGSSPSSDAQVNFNLATHPATSTAAAASVATSSPPETFTDGSGNKLVITQVQLVLREIELKRVDETSGCEGTEHDACEKLEVGPVLLDLPLGTPGAARSFSVPVAAGSYDEIEFEIHKPSDDEASDAAFVRAHPDFAGVSVKVDGTFNGQAFTYVTDLDAEEEIELSPPLVTSDAAATDLTLFVDLDKWFRDGTDNLVDPASANAGQANEGLVESNIRGTLHAFEDEDHDGMDDHHGGADDGPSHT